jgi:hypothetical protein
MADAGEHRETALPDLANLPLSQLKGIQPEALRKAVRILRERLQKEQDPINSFNATI